MSKIRQPPARVKAALLLITGLAIGAWYSYGIATGSRLAFPQHRLIFEIIMLLTFVWMLIWTRARRAHEASNTTDSGPSPSLSTPQIRFIRRTGPSQEQFSARIVA